ncbi:MAG: exodeoxyribonuclease V subunit gamma, partial [Pseudomonadota bacterium]
MATLRLFTSNRLEILAERLGEVLRTPLASPLASEIVVVQSRGMERWLSMQLAERHGICANFRFPFPNAFVQE